MGRVPIPPAGGRRSVLVLHVLVVLKGDIGQDDCVHRVVKFKALRVQKSGKQHVCNPVRSGPSVHEDHSPVQHVRTTCYLST